MIQARSVSQSHTILEHEIHFSPPRLVLKRIESGRQMDPKRSLVRGLTGRPVQGSGDGEDVALQRKWLEQNPEKLDASR